jgi:hypothetical protein
MGIPLLSVIIIICAAIIFQDVGYYENLTHSASLRKQVLTVSGSYINSRTGI